MKVEKFELIDQRDYTIDLDQNETILYYYLQIFREMLDEEYFVNNTVELINQTMQFNPLKPYLTFGDIRKAPRKYIDKELDWYLSQDLSINGWMDDVKIWNHVCTKDDKKEINSNYGWCIFSEANGNQYENALNALIKDQNTRQAIMIYTRPSMHTEYNRNGMHDFCCTNNVHVFIREQSLIYKVDQRSCDLVTGLFNDFAWHCFVYQQLLKDLEKNDIFIQSGVIDYNIGSLHIYERNYDLLKKLTDYKWNRNNNEEYDSQT